MRHSIKVSEITTSGWWWTVVVVVVSFLFVCFHDTNKKIRFEMNVGVRQSPSLCKAYL